MDNNTHIDSYYLGEPAVSYYIEIDDARILFDAGYSSAFLKNAADMGIDLGNLTHIVLSHGHDDHTGGLKPLAETFNHSHTPLIAHPQVFCKRWSDGLYIGAPITEAQARARFNFTPTAEPLRISENCFFLGEIPREIPFEPAYPIGLIEQSDGIFTDDYIMDDSAIACVVEGGIFIITGCSHSGICNIISYAEKLSGLKVVGVIGGFHMFDLDERTKETIEYVKHIPHMYPAHCVSLRVKGEMMKSLEIADVGVGMTLEI